MSKIGSYIGFSIKSGKALIGCDALEMKPYKAKTVLLSDSLSRNAIDKVLNLKIKYGFKAYRIKDEDFKNIVKKDNCKLIALTDGELSGAVESNIDSICAEVL